MDQEQHTGCQEIIVFVIRYRPGHYIFNALNCACRGLMWTFLLRESHSRFRDFARRCARSSQKRKFLGGAADWRSDLVEWR